MNREGASRRSVLVATVLVAIGSGLAAAPASAQPAAAAPPAAATGMTEAVVRKVDVEAGRITLKHGEIPNLDMGAMTMVFGVSDPALLKDVKRDAKVRFRAENRNGDYVVTALERVAD